MGAAVADMRVGVVDMGLPVSFGDMEIVFVRVAVLVLLLHVLPATLPALVHAAAVEMVAPAVLPVAAVDYG